MKSFLLVLLAVIMFGGCSSMNSNVIYAKAGSEVKIELDSNPTTGYSWIIDNKDALSNILLISSDYIPNVTDGKIVGSGGKEQFVFKAKEDKKGSDETIKFYYLRSWETETAPAREQEYKIIIK